MTWLAVHQYKFGNLSKYSEDLVLTGLKFTCAITYTTYVSPPPTHTHTDAFSHVWASVSYSIIIPFAFLRTQPPVLWSAGASEGDAESQDGV
jgi:hypothetical protein